MIVRHKLLADLVKLWKNDELVEKIDRLPIELSPRKSKPLGRCCVHKERAVWRYKTFPLMGLDMTDEHDEVTPLSEYARLALSRPEPDKENIMCVIDEACSSCVQINYEITNLCRGCVARSCYMNCPKDAIRFKKNGQAMIDHDTCVSCGICHKSCPYHAIVYIPVSYTHLDVYKRQVRNIPAIEAAFSKATRATLAGSTTPVSYTHLFKSYPLSEES